MRNGAHGAAEERTRLSWRRTSLSSTVVALLVLRVATRDRFSVLNAVAIAVTLLIWLAQMLLIQRRINAMERREPATIGRTLPATALTAVAFALLGLVLTVVH